MFCVLYGFPSSFRHVTSFRWSRPAYLALDSLLSLSRTLLTCLAKYFPLSCSIFTPFSYTLQGHEYPGSFSSLLAIAVAVQSRVCLDYKRFVLISKYTSFFHAKGLLPVCRITLSRPSLFLHLSSSSSHSEA